MPASEITGVIYLAESLKRVSSRTALRMREIREAPAT